MSDEDVNVIINSIDDEPKKYPWSHLIQENSDMDDESLELEEVQRLSRKLKQCEENLKKQKQKFQDLQKISEETFRDMEMKLNQHQETPLESVILLQSVLAYQKQLTGQEAYEKITRGVTAWLRQREKLQKFLRKLKVDTTAIQDSLFVTPEFLQESIERVFSSLGVE